VTIAAASPAAERPLRAPVELPPPAADAPPPGLEAASRAPVELPPPPADTPPPGLEAALPLTMREFLLGARGAAAAPPSLLELAGTAVGFAAAIVIVLEGADSAGAGSRERAATVLGDVVGVLCAVAFAAYITLSARLRAAGMPTFLLSLPANAVAGAALSLVVLAGGGTVCCAGAVGLADGFASSPAVAGTLVAMALVPGMLGHALMTLALDAVPPLALSLLGLQGIWIATLFGAAVGAQGMPSPATLGATPVLMAGAALAIVGGARAAAAAKR